MLTLNHSSLGDPTKVVELTHVISETAASLLGMLKKEADNQTNQLTMQQLLNTAKSLADAVSNLVETAKMVEEKPGVSYTYLYV